VTISLTGLKPWPDVPALKNASGIGTYNTILTRPSRNQICAHFAINVTRKVLILPSTWQPGMGAVLSLGQVTDSFIVKVNGFEVPFPDQLSAKVDIGPFLRRRFNILTVRVATTLQNELRTLDPVIGARPAQANGLVGPVILTTVESAPP